MFYDLNVTFDFVCNVNDLKVTFDFVCNVLRPYSDIWEFGILLTEDFYEVLLS